MKRYGIFILSMVALMLCISASMADTGQDSEHIFVFVSFSMPPESLKGWMREANQAHAPVVIRGLVNNSFKATIQKMTELTQDKLGGVQLDPTLFERFQIKQVPAVVLEKGSDFDVIYGDAKLSYALEKLRGHHET